MTQNSQACHKGKKKLKIIFMCSICRQRRLERSYTLYRRLPIDSTEFFFFSLSFSSYFLFFDALQKRESNTVHDFDVWNSMSKILAIIFFLCCKSGTGFLGFFWCLKGFEKKMCYWFFRGGFVCVSVLFVEEKTIPFFLLGTFEIANNKGR